MPPSDRSDRGEPHEALTALYDVDWSEDEKKELYEVDWSEPLHKRSFFDHVTAFFTRE